MKQAPIVETNNYENKWFIMGVTVPSRRKLTAEAVRVHMHDLLTEVNMSEIHVVEAVAETQVVFAPKAKEKKPKKSKG